MLANPTLLQIGFDVGSILAYSLILAFIMSMAVILIVIRRIQRTPQTPTQRLGSSPLSESELRFILRRLPSHDAEAIVRFMQLRQRRSETEPVRTAAQVKADALRSAGPKSFFYLDEKEVNDLHPQVVRELRPSRIERRETRGVTKGVTAQTPIVSPKYEKDSETQETRTYEIPPQRSIMYNEVESYLLDHGKLTCGLEDFEFDRSKLDEFRTLISRLRGRFNVKLPDNLETDVISDQMQEFAKSAIDALAKSSGYLFVLGDFTVENSADGCILSLKHPLSPYLVDPPPATIRITSVREYITPLGKSTFSDGRLVKVSCLGKKVGWDPETRILDVIPFAIF
jgi:hypothetical protein